MAKGKKEITTIVINDEFYVERDSMSYNLIRNGKANSKSGEVVDKLINVGFYNDMESCLKKAYILIAESKLDERTTVLDYIRELKATSNELNETLKKGLNG